MSDDHPDSSMNRAESISNARNSSPDRDEDHHDAMEVDSGLSMVVDHATDEADERMASSLPTRQYRDLESSSATPISSSTPTPTPVSFSREPPAFDEDTERPRQRRRFHVTLEDETDTEIRPGLSADGANADDETAVLESAPPRMSELTIATPPVERSGPMLDVVHDSPAPVPALAEPASPNQGNQSPYLGTIPLPDVPPPQPPNPNASLDAILEAARRLGSAGTATPDQIQSDLALLAPYIALQAVATAFPTGVRPAPPGGAGGGSNTGNPPAEGQTPAPNEGNNDAPPPVPPFAFLPPFLFGGNTERPPDPKRAERLANGLKVVEDGLLKRWKAVCGEQGAVCAVCYSELLEEPGIDKEPEEMDKEKAKTEAESDLKEPTTQDDHDQALRDALKRREEMERLEKEEKEHRLETAVLAFPCGHVFHRTCLLPWLSRHTTCPTCRFDIDPKSDTLTLPPDEDIPFPTGPGGFNLRDFFTVGPVLRVPRTRDGANPWARNNRGTARDQTEPTNNAPGSDAGRVPNPTSARASDPPSMAEMFEALFGPLLHSVGIPPQPTNARAGQPEGAAPVPTSIPGPGSPTSARSEQTGASASGSMPALESDDESPAPIADIPTTSIPAASSSAPPQPVDPPPVPPSIRRLAPPRPPRPSEDRDRPVAMFGRLTPRRPPQPITPSWMRPSRPAPAPAVTTAGSSSAPSSELSSMADSSAPTGTSTPSTPSSVPTSEGNSRPGLGQLREIVSNLIPRRVSASGRTSGAPSIRSTRSASSAISVSTTRDASQTNQSPLSPRAGLRAILHGSTSLFRGLTSSGRGRSRNRSGTSTSSASMPNLEDDSEVDTHFSEDGMESDIDDDMPALEPIEGRQRQAHTPTPAQSNPEADAPAGQNQPAAGTNGQTGRTTRTAGQDVMDSIITLRIDVVHPDGHDETIIVPLLFNPAGQAGTNAQTGNAQPAQPAQRTPSPPPARPRAPPPVNKWTPPEPVKTFRQVVEEKEREAGWRCDDPACLLGPADDEEPADEPHPIKPRYSIMRSITPEGPIRHHKSEDGIRVYAGGEDVRVKGENPVCDHTLHAECLVTSARVNGWSPPDDADPHARVTLRCPVCRHEGTIEREVWGAGVESEAESN